MAKKAKDEETTTSTPQVEADTTKEKLQRRRQSVATRLKFALNNLINAIETNEAIETALDAGKTLLNETGFGLRQSTVVTAQAIQQAMLGLDVMDDLTPTRMTKLGKLLGKAQRGEEVTEEMIEEIVGQSHDEDEADDEDDNADDDNNEVDDEDDNEEVDSPDDGE